MEKLGKITLQGECTAGGLQGKERAEVTAWGQCPWQEQTQEAGAAHWTTDTLVLRAEGHAYHVNRTVPYPQTKIQMDLSCKLLHLLYSCCWRDGACLQWMHLSLLLLSFSTPFTLENKSISVPTMTSTKPPPSPCQYPHPFWADALTLAACAKSVEAPWRVSRFSEHFATFQQAEDRAPQSSQPQAERPAQQLPLPTASPAKMQTFINTPSRNNCGTDWLVPSVPFFVSDTGIIYIRSATLSPKGELKVLRAKMCRRILVQV